MAVRSRILAGPFDLPTGLTLLYEVPAGRTAIVRTIALVNNTGATRTPILYVDHDGSGALPFWRGSMPTLTSLAVEYWMALDPGAQISSTGGLTAGNVHFTMFGALLLGEPE